MFFGIRTRLLVSYLVIAIVATAATSGYLYLSFQNLQTGYREHSLLANAYVLADAFGTDFGTDRGNARVKQVIEKLEREETDEFAVLDFAGTVIASTVASLPPGTSMSRLETHSSGRHHHTITHNVVDDDDRIVAEAPIRKDNRTIGWVRVWMPERYYQASLLPIKRVIIFALIGVSALCVALSCILAKAFLVPIREMSQLSKRIASGDFTVRARKSVNDELGQLSHDLNAMASRLQDLENARQDLVGNVSHELRSPVSNIRVAGEVLGRRVEKLGDDSARLFETVVAETDRLDGMIDELIELSSIESGAFSLNKERCDLAELLRATMSLYALRAERKGLSLTLQADSDVCIVADIERLQRAVGNLVDNAVKFTPEGGRIIVSTRNCSNSVTIDVSDTGEGVPQADLDRIFERFFRVDKARPRTGGAGLGLSIAKHIVEAHGGSISASRRAGGGSVFTLSVPLRDKEQNPGHPDMRI